MSELKDYILTGIDLIKKKTQELKAKKQTKKSQGTKRFARLTIYARRQRRF